MQHGRLRHPSATPQTGGPRLRQLYTVNQLAKELGITPRAIRFYEAKGLLAPERAGTTRVFDRRDRARLMLVLRGKRLGFSLNEIREYLGLYDAQHGQAEQIRWLLDSVRDRIARLEQQRADLEQTLAELRDIESQAADALSGQS
ncbi:MerR family transcriptional regulator [Roseomonas mucosa]|nr:MerR family DNA-binding transcriptional regulator [Roseomonas mucosa]MDT8293469.1 MerR family DNA-binding transcriptional regulator [Roseomonas mucosa]MDT8314662.1 MerR family DNA-binding transcriptional regulator [Roseomonas mucosa]MDT8349807.1 MerR family DNA-binding transcriptional regulator [Roseomonas mucosa]